MKTTQICAILQPGKLESRSAMMIISWQGYFFTSMEASTYIKSTNFVTSISLRSCWLSWPLMVYFRRWSTAEYHVVFKIDKYVMLISQECCCIGLDQVERVLGSSLGFSGPACQSQSSSSVICSSFAALRSSSSSAMRSLNQIKINAGFSQEDNQNWMWTNFLGATVNKGFKVFRRFGFAFLSQSIIYLEISRDWKDILCRSLLHLYHNDAKEE